MRSFIIALCIFALLILAIIFNGIFLRSTTGEMEAALRALPVAEEGEALLALENYWKNKRTGMSLSISFDEIRKMDELLIELRIAAQCKDENSFLLSRAQALEAVARMRRLECFSLEALI